MFSTFEYLGKNYVSISKIPFTSSPKVFRHEKSFYCDVELSALRTAAKMSDNATLKLILSF